ncbi:hypothetical protein jhhlp_004819 [Lomentospora prolificans]|uniref:L-2,4-diaminobutyrate decarboxylase n=1 Tax=Lomentospora prolificans TaxID=41688 RepID=A0A2N3N8J5_9PEZI|nr:hypothetical protein jhhlp_004819 [Lomentospora prolificans]
MSDLFDIKEWEASLSRRRQANHSNDPTLPPLSAIRAAESSLPNAIATDSLPGASQEDTIKHIVGDIVPALNGQAHSSRYYGFVTGGILPIAEWADNVVSHMDQNVSVHLPDQTVATTVEDTALKMIISLLRLGNAEDWGGRIFTTGATASNILGLTCGREAVLSKKLGGDGSAGELGLLAACVTAGVTEVQVLTSAGHSSLSKAASVVGFGRRSVKELGVSGDEPWRLDFAALERELQKPGTLSVISISAGEVNTGRHGVNGTEEMKKVRELADRYGAWLHVDGAFGIFSRALEDRSEYKTIRDRAGGIELADSITLDGHKLLNVPYDCGIFLTKSYLTLQSAFTNPNAAYLSSGAPSNIPSPLNIGLENSRRFRALPAYAVLLSEGRPGIAALLSNMTELTRRVARFIQESKHALNDVLVERINATRKIYVSPTTWKGEKAVRIAVSNWMVNVAKDFGVISSVLNEVAGNT